MAQTEAFVKIRSCFEGLPTVHVHPKHGGSFRFPIYMTETLDKTGIEALELSTRSFNCLRRAGINTIGELCNRVQSSGDLKSIRSCGNTSIAEIMDNLMYYQYSILKPERREKYLAEVIKMNVVN